MLSQIDSSSNLVNDDLFVSAVVLDALADSNNATVTQALANALLAQQQADGSWLDDTWTTALVLQGLLKRQANNPAASVASISGRVVIAGSTQPLNGVTVSVIGQSNASVVTGSDGRFLLSGVQAGSVNLSFTKPGYGSVSSGGQLLAGQQKDLGDIAMQAGSTSILLGGVVVDDSTGLPISGASIAISGGGSLISAGDGSFATTLSSSGSYQITVTDNGYNSWNGSVNLTTGQTTVHIGLLSVGTVLDNQPGNISGKVVDGNTGNGIAGATVSAAGVTTTSDASGQFTIANVARGTIIGAISASGYQGFTFTYPYLAGSLGNLGSLPLYAVGSSTVATSSTLHLTVIDAVSQQPLANAQVQVNGSSASTDINGVAVISNISSTSITAIVSLSGYLSSQLQLTGSGNGNLYATVPLTPQSASSSTLTISGVVTDTNSTPIANATLSVVGTSIQTVTDSQGNFTLSGITTLSFTLHVAANGYTSTDRVIQLQAYGSYTTNIQLVAASPDANGVSFIVHQVQAPQTPVNSNQDVLIQASIENASSTDQLVVVRALIIDLTGNIIATTPVYLPGTQQLSGTVGFKAGESLNLQLPWNTQQWSAGAYTIRVDVVQLGSINRDLPLGLIYASASDSLNIVSNTSLSGGFNFNPPMSQAGQQTPVTLGVLVRNSGNAVIQATTYQLQISNSQGAVLFNATTSAPQLNINGVATLDFGSWTPGATDSGNLVLTVQPQGVKVSPLTGSYYVGDVATASFTLDQQQFAAGNQSTAAHIKINGANGVQTLSSNPLTTQVQTALSNASAYISSTAVTWQRNSNCMSCHIQPQTLYGLSKSQDKVPVDHTALQYLFNSVQADVSNTGYLHTHGSWIVTPTSYGLWSLDAWSDRVATYRNRVKMLATLWSNRAADTSITPDHSSGWITPSYPEAVYSAIIPAIVHLIAEKNSIAAVAKQDYAMSQPLASPVDSHMYGVTTDGTYIYLAHWGGVDKFDPSTNSLTNVFYHYAWQYNGILVDGQDIYLTTPTSVEKVTSPTTSTPIASFPGSSNLQHIVKWNGSLYVSDYNMNTIWKIDNSNGVYTTSTFIAGGGLYRPMGMSIGKDNQLVVANNGYKNILAYQPDGSHQVLYDGMVMAPMNVVYIASEDNYYFTTNVGQSGGVFGPTHSGCAINRGKPDGTIERLTENQNLYSTSYYDLTYFNNNIYVGNLLDNTLIRLQGASFDDSVIDDVAANIPNIANYILSKPVDRYNVIDAQRMYTLAKLKPLVSDTARQAQIDTALHNYDQYLRAQQNTDGGWGAYGVNSTASSPSATAWAGLALDTLNPSISDPVVSKAVIYLLSAQKPNGAWHYDQYVFTQSELGPTGLVMSYLPIALARLSGLDVDLDLISRPDVTLSGFSVAPQATTPQPDGGALYHWHLSGVGANGQQIDFGASLNNLLPGEQRPVAENAALGFHNTFTNEVMTRPIDVPVVNVFNGLVLNTSTDSLLYGANAPVVVSNALVNTGLPINSGTLKSVIQTSAGSVIYTFPDQTGIALAQGATITLPANWNTTNVLAGNYQVISQFYDDTSLLRATSVASFNIGGTDSGGNAVTYGTHVYTDKLNYHPIDTVAIHSRIQNLTVNASQAAVLAKLSVVDSQSNTIFSKQWVVPQIAASGLLDYTNNLSLVNAVVGSDTVTLQIWDASLTSLLATSTYNFVVVNDPLGQIAGKVVSNPKSVWQGQPLTCIDTVINKSTMVDAAITLEKLLVNADTQVVVSDSSAQQTLTASTSSTSMRNIETSTLAVGNYACVLQAKTNESVSALGYAAFAVTVPPINISISSQVGTHGRILILLDTASQTDGREQYLRSVLDASSWSYDIVYSEADFAVDLVTAQYMEYGLFAQTITLSDKTETALAVEVNKGKGLIIATPVDHCDALLQTMLGARLAYEPLANSGQDSEHRHINTTQVVFPLNTLGVGWPATTITQDVFEDADPTSALTIAYVLKQCAVDGIDHHPHHDNSLVPANITAEHQGGGDHSHDGNHHDGNNGGGQQDGGQDEGDHGSHETDAAVTANKYGLGIAMFIGFDVIKQAVTVPSQTNVYTSLLNYSFNEVHPSPLPVSASNAVPVVIQLQNEAAATQVRLRLSDTVNARFVTGMGWTQVTDNGQSYWQYTGSLAIAASISSTVYIQLLDNNAVTMSIAIDTSSDGTNWVAYKQSTIAINPVTLAAPPSQPPVIQVQNCSCTSDTHDDGREPSVGQGHDHHGSGNGYGHCKPDHDNNNDNQQDNGHHHKHDDHGKH